VGCTLGSRYCIHVGIEKYFYPLICKKHEDQKKAILRVVFYGRETFSLTLGKKIGGVFDNRMLKN